MDRLLQDRWHKVYDGNSEDHGRTIIAYLSSYAQFLFSSKSHLVPGITRQELYEFIQASQHTASRLDHWSYADMQLVPAKSLGALASLLMLIEGGTPWPQQLLPSRAHLLNEDPSKPHDPLSYRCLLLTAPYCTASGEKSGCDICNHGSVHGGWMKYTVVSVTLGQMTPGSIQRLMSSLRCYITTLWSEVLSTSSNVLTRLLEVYYIAFSSWRACPGAYLSPTFGFKSPL